MARRAKLEMFLIEMRGRRNLTQKELAEVLGIDHHIISHWESGRRKPNGAQLQLLLQHMRFSLRERDDLATVCDQENIGINLPRSLRPVLTGDEALADLSTFYFGGSFEKRLERIRARRAKQ
jgi:transcriptional regulator with XRE-family HTH domain